MSDPRDEQRPATRRMEPIDPSAGAAHQPPTEGYPAPAPAAPASGAYQDPGYRDPAPYAGATGTQPVASPPPNRSRTVLLGLIAGLALLVLVLAGYLVISGAGSSDDDAVAGADSSTTSATTTESRTTPSSTTTTTTSENTRPTAAPGAITYQFTGNGNLIGVRYRDGSGEQVVATAGSPWSVRVTLDPSAAAHVTGIVVNGAVTCNILHGEELLASSTSRGGPLTCSATVPD